MKADLGEGVGLAGCAFRRIGSIRNDRGCSWREEGPVTLAALRLPGVTLAKRTAIGDEHQQRDL